MLNIYSSIFGERGVICLCVFAMSWYSFLIRKLDFSLIRTLVGLPLGMYTLLKCFSFFVASITTKEVFWLIGSSIGYIVQDTVK